MFKIFGEYRFPYAESLEALRKPVVIAHGKMALRNSMGVHPMEASDANRDGSPSDYTYRRYRRFFSSGVGLVWFEAMAVQEDGRSNPFSTYLCEDTLEAYKRFIGTLKEENPDVKCVAQLTHSGRISAPDGTPKPIIAMWNPHVNGRRYVPDDCPIVSDEYIERVVERFGVAAKLAEEAGFDAIDIKACSGYLYSELLCARTRAGKYGGSLENRARAFLDSVASVKASVGSGIVLASRYGFIENMPWPFSFGMGRSKEAQLEWDLAEPLQVLDWMADAGVELVNPTCGKAAIDFDYTKLTPDDVKSDTGLSYFDKFYRGTTALQKAHPELAVIGADYSSLRTDAFNVAAGALEEGCMTLAGFGRMAVSYAKFAQDIMDGGFDPEQCCIECGCCSKLLAAQKPSGCVTHDEELFLPLFKEIGK